MNFPKGEAIALHTLLLHVRNLLQARGLAGDLSFRDYEAFGVRPHMVNRRQQDHLRALFLLAKGFGGVAAAGDDLSSAGRLAQRLADLAELHDSGQDARRQAAHQEASL